MPDLGAIADQMSTSPQSLTIWLGVVSAIVAVVLGIANLAINLKYRLRQEKWNRLQKADALIESLYGDEYSHAALRLTDGSLTRLKLLPEFWSDPGKPEFANVSMREVEAALLTSVDGHNGSPVATTICHCFDILIARFNKMEFYVKRDLVDFDDLRWPLKYYFLYVDKELFFNYIDRIGYDNAKIFLERFRDWRQIKPAS